MESIIENPLDVSVEAEKLFQDGTDFEFPTNPFESIGLAFSGGGYRAAAYALGTLSVFDALKTEDGTSLLQKVKFISSASGGTITAVTYVASLRENMPFAEFFTHLNKTITQEELLHQALGDLSEAQNWEGLPKARNPINAFARTYHNTLLSFVKEENRTLDHIMSGNDASFHIEEFCFNASEFYTGLSFRFQGGPKGWKSKSGGKFGNSNIRIASKTAVDTLRQIRLADILAASSCFPLGFEPIMFPRDFHYPGGPGVDELRSALEMDPYSWKEGDVYNNSRSRRATAEKEFTECGEFGLMDGGICDNQGLYSLLMANKRKVKKSGGTKAKNRFDLMMVSDVTSFFMQPFKEPVTEANHWNQDTPEQYWNNFTKMPAKIRKTLIIGYIAGGLIGCLSLFPLIKQGASLSTVLLAVIGQLPILGVGVAGYLYNRFKSSKKQLFTLLEKKTLEELFTHYYPDNSFIGRIGTKMVSHLKQTKLQELFTMAQTRAHSSATMISEVFLKHIRRLIYDQLFSNPAYRYRRLGNFIYALSYTNAKNKRQVSLDEAEEKGDTTYAGRKAAFDSDVDAYFKLSPQMQDVAELAYNAPTTLWFTPEQETDNQHNLRKAIIATGQFTTCHNLLKYALQLKHSKYFDTLETPAQNRILSITTQLATMMQEFEKDPHYLYNRLAD